MKRSRRDHRMNKRLVNLPSMPSLPSVSSSARWQDVVARYHRADPRRAVWQVINSLGPFVALWVLMYLSLGVSYWLTLALAVPTAGFLVRIFIISHDCGHGSFFASRKANDFVGFWFGLLAFTPYFYWTHSHAIHHATAGNLDRRGTGDVWTMTVREYRESTGWQRLKFRVYRNPLVMFLIGPAVMFLIVSRFAAPGSGRRWHLSVLWANLTGLALIAALVAVMGLKAYLIIQLPVILFAGTGGVWLFYVQHQFEGVYWERQKNWSYMDVALRGSSYYRLPKVLQWFSGNIGYHHIHHLSPRIPNYFLEKCHRENAIFQKAKTLRVRESLKCVRFRLWDEERQRLVGLGAFFL
jgi:omega-6 fatty acid desaturase (delta-12 desaturase)